MTNPFDALDPSASSHLVNVALNKPAQQSSMSEWSQPNEAGNAVSGQMPSDFAFHTAKEQNPWWSVDLGIVYPLEAIVISNRLSMCWDRCKSICIEVSSDGSAWVLLHAGFTVFGNRLAGDPFVLLLKGAINGRFVRISLQGVEALHMSQVEIFVKAEAVALLEYCHINRISALPIQLSSYRIIGGESASNKHIVGLDVSRSSARFGNLLIQYTNAIVLAQRTGLRYIRLAEHDLLNVRTGFTANGLEFLPKSAALPTTGYFMEGEFFASDCFVPVLMPFLRFTPEDECVFARVAREFVRPYMLTGVPLANEKHPEDEVTIHLRSGDVFAPYHPIVRGYRQPPLSFYKLVINHLMKEHGVQRVRLVFEDRGNPCVNTLEAWLNSEDIPFRSQCGSLQQDMSALIDAPHLVFGHGTFGYAVCRLSKRIKTVHYFEPELGGVYGYITTIERVFSVADVQGKYFKAFEYGKPMEDVEGWFNTPEDRECMLSYPIEALVLKELMSVVQTGEPTRYRAARI